MAHEPAWRRYLRFHRDDPRADLDDELRDHLASLERELVTGGLGPDEARAEAVRRFGDVERVRSAVVRQDERLAIRRRRLARFEVLRQDLRFALRQLRRSPGFAITATLSIALGVTGNVAIFALANVLLFRPIPGAGAEGLVRMYRGHHSGLQYRDIAFFRERTSAFSHLVAERNLAMVMRTDREPERVNASMVTSRFFDALGVRMALGRPFLGDERSPGAEGVPVVLSHAFWRSRFGADSGIVGRVLVLNGTPVTVAGVAGPSFVSSVLGWSPSLWVPMADAPLLTGERPEEVGASMYVTGRLGPGVSPSRAEAELGVIMSQLAATDTAAYARMTVRLDHTRGVNAELRGLVALVTIFLMVLVLLVLLIACANVANLLLARGTARRTEIGVRLAVGASRGRLVRQLLTESAVVAAIGGVLALALAVVTVRLLEGALPAEARMALDLSPDVRVLVYTAGLCMLATLAFGLVPALRASRPDLVVALKAESGRGGASRSRLRSVLVVAQVAFCALMLAVASFFVRSLRNAEHIEPGFQTAGVQDARIDFGARAVDDEDVRALYAGLLERSASIPQVRGVALASLVPLSGNNMQTRMLPEGMKALTERDWPMPYFNVVSGGYLGLLGIPLVAGRDFRRADDAGAPRVAIVNETAARRWWPDGAAVGRTIRMEGDSTPMTVIGVARDIKYNTLGESTPPFVYLPFWQATRAEMILHLAVQGDGEALRGGIWDALRDLDPSLPPPRVRPMAEEVRISLLPAQIGATLVGAFGLIALLLATAGVYGVTSFNVVQRTREIGIRSALGADRRDILRLVLGGTMRLVTIGAVLGVVGAIAIGRAASAMLYGVNPADPRSFLAAPLFLCAVALVASFLPARRATTVHPMAAMRAE